MRPLRIGAFQFDVRRGDVAANLAEVRAGLEEAAGAGVELLVLPEMWPTSFVGDGDDARWLAETEAAVEELAGWSRELGLAVGGSGFGPGEPEERLRNRMHVFDRGREVLSYDKVHLFSPTAETMGFSGGRVPPPTERVAGALVSGAICYDLRFGPMLRAPFLAGAEILVVPAQWPETRATHWRALIRGRAIEHQAFVIGANRTGTDHVGRRRIELVFPGNSIVVDPHGEVLAEGDGRRGLVQAEVDLDALRRLRRNVPVRGDERPALYCDWGG